ncbi:MAG: tetratricopeptide repeat protein [Nannocystaceae bacterium]|nr:tetratricopeptide repeat protein [bacterium]
MDVLAPFLALPIAISLAVAPPAEDKAPAAAPADVAPPGTAPTEPPRQDPQLERAMESYELGKKAYNAARYEDALGHFQEAATRYASPDFQYNIGLCYERLGKPDEAIRAFRTYLRAKPDADDRANVEDRIFQLERDIERAKTDPDGQVEPDPEPEPVSQPEPPKPSRPFIITGAVLAGVGGALALGGGIGFGVAAADRSNAVDEVNDGNPQGLTFAEVQTLDDEGRRFETLQIVTAAAGAAVAVTGVALLAVGLKRKKAAEGSPTATLVPTWTGRSAGLSLQGRF